MAEVGRTVRVSGLPTDVENNRLKDKLLIYFLRARNGGGEIDLIRIVTTASHSALITFEDSSVAHRIVQIKWHTLEVDGKKYKLTATKHQERLDPDQVILHLSATLDYTQLPGGVEALSSLKKNHRKVQIDYSASKGCCTLFGSYSNVYSALTQLLGHPGVLELAENSDSSFQTAPSSSRSVQTSKKSQVSEDQSRKTNKQREQKETDNTDKSSNEESSSSNKNLSPGSNGWKTNANAVSAAPQSPTTFMEDFSLIVDADMFQYLQKHCKKEYQRILSQFGVEVVNETTQGVTTLFLQVADTAMMEGGQERLKLARTAISRLYQENEAKICRDQLSKLILRPRGGLHRVMDNLSVRFPKLLLNEDEQNVYIIGNMQDVSEARRVLLLDEVEVRDKKEDVASLLKFPLYNLRSSSPHADEEEVHLSLPGSLDAVADETLKSEEDELRAEGAAKYKLAARFKDSGLGGLGSRPVKFNFQPNVMLSRQTHHEPVLGHDVFPETNRVFCEALSRDPNTGGDIPFRTTYTSSPSASTQVKTSLNPDTIKTQRKSLTTSPSSTTLSSFPESTARPPVGSGSTLKRASSFSGTPQQKAQVVGLKSQDDSSKSTTRRSSSFSSQAGKDKQEVHNAEMIVSKLIWEYIKETYSTRVKHLTTEVQLKESSGVGSREQTVFLKGADLSKVRQCQEHLEKLVASVSADFSVKELSWSELGVTDSENEALKACCAEVQSHLKKIIIHRSKNALYVAGPEEMCSQVAATLQEVFFKEPEHHGLLSPSKSMRSSATLQFSDPQGVHLNNSQLDLGTQKNKTDHQQYRTTYGTDYGRKEVLNGSSSQSSVRKDHFVKTKVTVGEDGHKATVKDMSLVNGDLSADKERTLQTTQTGWRDTEIPNTPNESISDQRGQTYSCVCGEHETQLVRSKCGVKMCSKCLEMRHTHCRVCTAMEQTSWGIQGEMKISRLTNMSLPGHNKDGVIKISYHIHDGVQGEGHPFPGKPFKGGTFEGFLPDNETAMKLLPRLEKAFRQELTFTVTAKWTEPMVTWGQIPHKTSLQGGKSQKGYPDSGYLTRLSEILSSLGID